MTRRRLHGNWHRTGASRWCKECHKWVTLEEWSEHKRHGPYRLPDETIEKYKND